MKEKDRDDFVKEDSLIINEIKESLDRLDESVEVRTPDMGKFRKLVMQVEESKKVRRRNETFLFMLSAAVILSLEVYAFNQSFINFAVLQAAAVVGFSICISVLYRKGKGRADVSL